MPRVAKLELDRSHWRSMEQGPWLDVDLSAVQRNARRFAALVGVRLMPMVKANGYGLGGIAVARCLEALGPWGFGVATAAEGKALREAGIARPILVFWPFVPDMGPTYHAADLRPAIGDLKGLAAWTALGGRPFHLAIDTGMGRTGFRWHDQETLAALRTALADARGYEGAFTHFHSADVAHEATELQWTRFHEVLKALGGAPPLVHATNSAGAQWGDRYSGTLARPGIYLYGGRAGRLEPDSVAALTASVLAVRQIRAGDTISYGASWRAEGACDVATLGIGYADGVLRGLSNRGQVAIEGLDQPASIVGRVTMDMTMVAVPAGSVRVGARATLWGGSIDIDAQAARAGTIAYELLTATGPRVLRRYLGVS